MWQRFLAVLKARNIEFWRDKGTLAWNFLFPVLMIVGFAFLFSDEGRPTYKIGVYGDLKEELTFRQLRYVEWVDYTDSALAQRKLSQHQIDMLLDAERRTFFINKTSPNGYFLAQLIRAQHPDWQQQQVQGKAVRYVDWVLPGILGMNIMFSCLFGVGYVIVRYRKNGVLKRLKATPLSAFEFVSAQVLSRLFIVMSSATAIYVGCDLFLNFYMLGSYLLLFVVGVLGSVCLISLGLLVACRSRSEELTGGLLNFTSWPMLFLSSVWFSLEGAPQFLKIVADFLPLTHLVAAARGIMTQGETLADISDHLLVLTAMTIVFLALASWLFRWEGDTR